MLGSIKCLRWCLSVDIALPELRSGLLLVRGHLRVDRQNATHKHIMIWRSNTNGTDSLNVRSSSQTQMELQLRKWMPGRRPVRCWLKRKHSLVIVVHSVVVVEVDTRSLPRAVLEAESL